MTFFLLALDCCGGNPSETCLRLGSVEVQTPERVVPMSAELSYMGSVTG